MKLKQYWRELQRRHVVKAGIAYLVVAWLLIQVFSILFPVFKAPDWAMQMTVIVLAVGFPIWLILAWVYDFSWGGIQKTEDVPFDPEVSRKKNIGLNRVIIGGLSIAVILLLANTARLSGKVDAMEEEYQAMNFTNSLAILPFEDLSPEKDQRYFSDGLARSIYDRLARFKDLKLISPTSSFQYRDKDVSIEVIAKELGVRYILEGNVQLFDSRYRASINLVDTEDGSTIWSKTFDNTLEDVLDTYDEVALNVGQYLNVTISSADVRQRKVDPEAYLLYLKAEDTLRYWTNEGALAADSLIRRSIRIDPGYAQSHATFSMTTLHKGLYWDGYPVDEAVKMGLRSARKALELDSNYYRGHMWLSNWQWHAREGETSQNILNAAIEMFPNNADILYYAAHQAARQNRMEDARNLSKRSIALDPKHDGGYLWLLYSDYMLGYLDEAEEALKAMFEVSIGEAGMNGEMGYLYVLKDKPEIALQHASKEKEFEYSRLLVQTLAYQKLGKQQEADSTFIAFKNSKDNRFEGFGQAVIFAAREEKDSAFYYLKRSREYVEINLENLFTFPELRNLYDDPRWDAYIDSLSEEFNYDFPHRSE